MQPLDVATVATAIVMALVFARPLLEEWALSDYFQEGGLGDYPSLARRFPLRALQVVPNAVYHALGGGAIAGFAIGFGLLLAAKYVALRWAVGPFLPAWTAWLVATMGVVLLPWTAAWRLRYSAAELSAVFLFVALGAALRTRGRVRSGWTIATAVAVALMLATYQALAICAFLLPLIVLVCLPPSPADAARPAKGRVAKVLSAWTPVALGGLLYAIYAKIAVLIVGSAGYEGALTGGSARVFSVANAIDAVAPIYGTAFSRAPWTFPLLAMLLLALVGGLLAASPARSMRIRWVVGLGVAILLLPLLALPYLVNSAFLHDPDRVGFPVAVGFVLLAVAALLHLEPTATRPPDLAVRRERDLVIPAIGVALLLWALPLANDNRRDYDLQDRILTATTRAAAAADSRSVLVQDYTGKFGDVYLLYETALEDALAARDSSVTTAVLCTPAEIDRFMPDATALGIPTTPRCEDVAPVSPPPVIVNIVPGDGGSFSVVPVG